MEFWTQQPKDLANQLRSDVDKGLPPGIREQILRETSIDSKVVHPAARILLGQFKSPILLLLIAAAGLSFGLHQPVDGTVVLLIILGSAIIGFQHEYRADQAVAKLMSMVETQMTILQDGNEVQVPSKSIVPGDVVLVSAGSIIPADGILISGENLFADEAALTGETFPVEKHKSVSAADTPMALRFNVLYSGSHIASGSGRFLAVQTGSETQLGGIAKGLGVQRPEADFEKGIRQFGMLLVNLTLLLTLGVFAINTILGRPILESFLFALALAVGLTPQLLPAIVSVNLSRGAVEMAKEKVIVKRLAAIENLGSMNVLCSDKTGTLTLGVVKLHGAYNVSGNEDPEVFKLAQVNALRQAGFRNPIDESLAGSAPEELKIFPRLIAEIPYDFIRKRLSVLVEAEKPLLISKGALDPILDSCIMTESGRAAIQDLFLKYSEQGYRVLGVATKELPLDSTTVSTSDEQGMCLRGLIVLEDPLRPEIADTIQRLRDLGVELKVITGDNRLVAHTLAKKMGLKYPIPITGEDLQSMSDSALIHRVKKSQVFAEIEPNQKARIIHALKRAGNVVGYIGDGINDGSALHTADAGISVSNAVDVAKEAADFVMLESGLDVLINAVLEGRRTFANTMKYIFMATSANFGNMFSLAGASLLVPFLPLLPKQVLMMNFLTDIPEMFIASDTVDPSQQLKPQRWDIKFLRRFMIVFGILSSAFDFATFGTLLYLKVPENVFRTAWFVESVASAALIVLVVRSRTPMFKSKPGTRLLQATLAIVVLVFVLPFTPIAPIFGLTALTPALVLAVSLIIFLYITSAEITKHLFFRVKSNQ